MNPFQTSSNTYLIAKQMASSPNDEQTKRGAEEPGLLLHNNTYYSLRFAVVAAVYQLGKWINNYGMCSLRTLLVRLHQ